MCRIAGVVNPSYSLTELTNTVKEMCQILKKGGPDNEGQYCNENISISLGHRRLSLIDVTSAANQPMSYENDRYQITFNGEIYNYLELKEELIRKGATFRTNSDTEVILAAFAAWGPASFERFNGMFAFALLDNKTKELFLVRDAVGIKPLYYAATNEGIAFASEIKAFKPIPYLQENNPSSNVYLLAYGHLPEPTTTLKHVRSLAKGSYLQYNILNADHCIKTFNKFSYTENIITRTDAVSLIKKTLQDAVQRHMIADAPIGVFLSGGLDSSLIALLASDVKKTELKTISLYFDDPKFSEKKFQDIVQQNLQGNKHQYLLVEETFHKFLPSVLSDMDQPTCDGINTWFISKYAKECGLKAVLSGIGGDELFGGYPSFERIKTVLTLENLPDKILNAGRFSNSKKLRRLPYLNIKGPVGRYLFLRGLFTPIEIAKQLDMDLREVMQLLQEQPIINTDIDSLSPQNQASWLEMNLYMQNQLLHDADVMSMAHGIEIRVPFLDKELIKLALQIKSSIKYAGSNNKQLLIDPFKHTLPQSVWDRPKMGFTFPFKNWMKNDTLIKDTMAAKGKKGLENYHQFNSGKIHWSQLMALMLQQ